MEPTNTLAARPLEGTVLHVKGGQEEVEGKGSYRPTGR
jgi:hypothetical protein